MSPESRTLEELGGELGDESPYTDVHPFVLERSRRVVAFLSLCNLDGEALVEGPLLEPGAPAETLGPLVARVVETARAFSYPFVEAFVDEENVRAQAALEEGGFAPFRTTYIYSLGPSGAPPVGFSPFRFEGAGVGGGAEGDVEVSTYRSLYRDTSDNWATRLAWSDEDLIERFTDPDVRLLLAYDADAPVGHLELEFFPEDGFAEVAYFGVLPRARGRGLGGALLARAAQEAFQYEDITPLAGARARRRTPGVPYAGKGRLQALARDGGADARAGRGGVRRKVKSWRNVLPRPSAPHVTTALSFLVS